MSGRTRKRQRGFTLVELLVSSIILGFGLVALAQLYMAATWTYQKGRYTSVATQRAQYELEKVHNLGYDGLMTIPLIDPLRYPNAEYDALSTGNGVTFTVSGLPKGTGTVTFARYAENGTTIDNVLKVDIEIVWDSSPKSEAIVKLSTLKVGRETTEGSGS